LDQTLQERRNLCPVAAPAPRLGRGGVRLVPAALVDDSGVLARIGDGFRQRIVEIARVGQHL
jgi:hypothetical protein